MAKTLLRGLDLIEAVDLNGPMTITELSRVTGTELSIVSRTVSALEADGWLVRVARKVSVGPRCALLGLTSPASDAIRRSEPLVRAIVGATGLSTSASALVGHEVMVLAVSVVGPLGASMSAGVPTRVPLHLMADGRAIASLLTPEMLTAVLPSEPYPCGDGVDDETRIGPAMRTFLAGEPASARRAIPTSRAELDVAIEQIRTEGFSRDTGQLQPWAHCIARPWPAAGLPAAIACVGSREEISERESVVRACLVAASEPGATAQDVVRAAAGALTTV